MMVLLTFALSFAGFAALALAMTKHHRDLFGEAPERVREYAFQIVGWGLLGASLIPAITGWGLSIGLAFWFGIAMVAALAVALALTYGQSLLKSACTSHPETKSR